MKTIRLDGVVGLDILAEDVARQMEGQESVKLILNSGGGHILEGFSIFNLIKDFNGRTEAHIDYAGSMMSLIAMAADSRYMKANSSILMTHRPHGGTGGNSEDLRAHADVLDKLEAMLVSTYSEVTGMSKDEATEYLSEEKYLNAEEAFNYGFIDGIEDGKTDLSLVAMAGMKAHEKVDFDMSKFCAKMEAIANNKQAVIKNAFSNCQTLREVERAIKSEYKLSQSAATAIVGAVKKQVHRECDSMASEKNEFEAKQLREAFNQFEIGNHYGTTSGIKTGL